MTRFLGMGKSSMMACLAIAYMGPWPISTALSNNLSSGVPNKEATSQLPLQTGMGSGIKMPHEVTTNPLEFRVLGDDVGYELENELVHAFQSDSKNPKYPYLLSLLYQKMQLQDREDKDYYLARAAFLARQAYELDKKSAYGYVALANLLFLASQQEKALNLLQKIRPSLNESELWLLDYSEAIFLREMDRPEEAFAKIATLFENENNYVRSLATELCHLTCLRIEADVLMPLLKRWQAQTKNVKISSLLAKNLIRSGQKMKARSILMQSVRDNPFSHEAKIELAENYLTETPLMPESALGLIKKHLKLADSEKMKTGGTSPPQSIILSQEFETNNRLKTDSLPEEIDYLNRTSTLNQKQKVAFLKILGTAWLRGGSIKSAEIAFLNYLQLNHNKFAAKEVVGLYIGQNKSKAGISFIDKFIEIKPGEASLHGLRGELSQQDKLTLEEAAEDYINAITLRPDDTTFYNSLGLIYFKMNRLESAIAVFEKSVVLNPKDSGAFYNLACAQALSGKDELAINALEKAIAMSPELSIDALRDKIFEGFKSSLRFQTIIESAISH